MTNDVESPAELMSKKKTKPLSMKRLFDTVKLVSVRRSLGLSVREVAVKLGMNPKTYWRIEHGVSDVSLKRALLIARFYDKPVEYLFRVMDHQPDQF